MDVRLIAVSPKGTRKMFPLTAETTLLGRQEDCSLRIPLEEISRRHCQLVLGEDEVVVKDLESANGTFVNGKKITEQELKGGDVLSLANALHLVVQIDGKPAEIDENKIRIPHLKPTDTDRKPKDRPGQAEPASPFSATSTTSTNKDVAEEILGESFFLDLEEDEEEE